MNGPFLIQTAPPFFFLSGPIFCFLIGSIPFGFLIGKANGMDIRRHGSGNIGATNVLRVLGRKWGALAFAFDVAKGFVPVFVIMRLTGGWETALAREWLWVACGTAAILGHNYTPWLGFKGGKGIATSAGVLGALVFWTMAVSLAVWVIGVKLTRTVSIGSIAASLTLPVATAFIYPGQNVLLLFASLAGFLGIWRHRANIARLRTGTEPKIGDQKAE